METNANKKTPYRANLYTEFILWTAMPEPEQRSLGLENQKQFAAYHKVAESTLSRWKERPDFEERVDKILKLWSVGKTPNVVMGMYRAAVKGNPMSQLLWLQYFKGFNPKQEIVHTVKVQMAPEDLRFLVDGMPDEYKQKFYGYIREIIDTGIALRNVGRLQDGNAPSPVDEAIVLDPADQDAPDLPDYAAGQISARNTPSIRADMERSFFSRHYKGAARWW